MMGRHKEEMQKFTRLAAAINESVEDVCNMPEKERSELMKVMHIEDEEAGGGRPENEGYSSKDEVEDIQSKRSNRLSKRKQEFDALYDWNNDEDFVDDDTKKPKDTSGAAGSKDSGWLSVTDQPSTSSGLTASGRPSRQAAVKANARVECINRFYKRPQSHSRLNVSTDIEEFSSREAQPRRKSMEQTSPIKRESTRVRSQSQRNSYEGPNVTANENKRDEDDKIAQLIDSLNGKLKMSPLIPHIQSPKDFMRDLDDLPLMDCDKLQRRIGIESKDDKAADSILSKHLKIVRNISCKGLFHSSRSPLSWQKVLSSRKKHLEVKLERKKVLEMSEVRISSCTEVRKYYCNT